MQNNFYKILILILILLTNKVIASELQECKWNNSKGIPCININKTPNTSTYSEQGVSKLVITKEDINKSGAVDVVDVLEMIDGIDLKQNGQRGQSSSLFMRGTNSNHTLVLLNGIPINDQSTTQGLHNFGVDFVQTIQQIEVYKGPNGAHFGPSAIGGAINFVTSIDYTNKFSISGYNRRNDSVDANYTKITDNGWHLNLKGSTTNSKNGSSRYAGTAGREEDGAKNYQVNLNATKWISDNLKFNSTVYSRRTKAHYDASSSDETGFAHDKMYVFQTNLNSINKNSENLLTFHYHQNNREYDESGYFSWYNNDSAVIKAERKIKAIEKISYGYGTEYKYDGAEFTNNGSWSSPTARENYDNLGFFANTGYQYSKNTIFSLYGRTDNHKVTGSNSTYKINLTQFLNNFKLSLTHSTGLRNPSLYELYGENGRTDSYKHVGNLDAKPEKSKTNEFKVKYFISEKLSLENSFYRTSITDALLYDGSFKGGSGYTNSQSDLNQDGIESNLTFKGEAQKFSIFNTIASSRKVDGTRQLNRPDSTYGISYSKKFINKLIGPFNLNYNYKHYGKSFDYKPGVTKVDSTDIMNLSLSKETTIGLWSVNITNLLDEKYQRPEGYGQNGRLIRFKLDKLF